MQRHSLICVASLFYAGCKVLFTNQELIITKQIKWYGNDGIIGENVVENTTATIKTFCQLSIPTEHNGIIDQFPTCHIFQPSRISLAGSHQAGLLRSSPRNQSKTFANVFRRISPHGNGTPRSIAH